MILACALLTFALPCEVRAQNEEERRRPSTAELAESARQELAEGRSEEAVSILTELAAGYPDDPGIRWLLARALDQSGASDPALAEYATALAMAPEDRWLRLEYGRALLYRRQTAKARDVLDPVRVDRAAPAAAAQAETLVGLGWYWDGNLTTAALHLRRALELDPSSTEAAGALSKVDAARSTVLRFATSLSDDDQPLRSLGQTAGIEASPHGRVRLDVSVGGRILRADDLPRTAFGPPRGPGTGPPSRPGTSSTDRRFLHSRLGLGFAPPGGRLGLESWVGSLSREGHTTTIEGGGTVRIGLATDTHLSLEYARSAYLWTVASLTDPVTASAIEVSLDRGAAPRWAGQAVYRGEGFGDDNRVHAWSGWMLAPLRVSSSGSIRAGYAASMEDSRFSTYSVQAQGIPASGPSLSGVYAPYYTPEQVRTHSVLLSGRAGAVESAHANLTWSYAPSASELAPEISVHEPAGDPVIMFAERTFHPWSLRGDAAIPLSRTTELRIEAERRRTAFYLYSRAELELRYRFVPDGP